MTTFHRIVSRILLSFLTVYGIGAAFGADTMETVKLPEAGATIDGETSSIGLRGNDGSLSFQIPLPNLPSPPSSQVNLSLRYNQNSGLRGSGLGIGWSFSTPAITMDRRTGTATAGQRKNGAFYSALSLSGQRLDFIANEGSAGIRYALEGSNTPVSIHYHKGTIRYHLHTNHPEESIEITSGWVVRYEDGAIHLFADQRNSDTNGTENSTFTDSWPLRYHLRPVTADSYDVVEYIYRKVAGRHYLSSINFAGGRSRYVFDGVILGQEYAGITNDFNSTSRQSSRFLYTQIKAQLDAKTRHQWCLIYNLYSLESQTNEKLAHPNCSSLLEENFLQQHTPTNGSRVPQLVSLYRMGTTIASSTEADLRKADLHFHYSHWSHHHETEKTTVYPLPFDRQTANKLLSNRFVVADVNQDALMDIINRDGNQTSVLLGNADLKRSFDQATILALKGVPGGLDFSNGQNHFVDMNGDSQTDILRYPSTSSPQILIHLGDGQGGYYEPKQDPLTVTLKRSGVQLMPRHFREGRARWIDLNNDGLTDIAMIDPSGKNLEYCYNRAQLTGNVFYCKSTPYPGEVLAPSLNRSDVHLRDFNGDGLADLLEYISDHRGIGVCYYPNRGDIYQRVWPNPFGVPNNQKRCNGLGYWLEIKDFGARQTKLDQIWSIDVNGDGSRDFVQLRGDNNDSLAIWYVLGDGRVQQQPETMLLNASIPSWINLNRRSRVLDIDSDGHDEILIIDPNSSTQPAQVIDFNRHPDTNLVKPNLLTAVVSSSGLRYDIAYSTAIDEFVRSGDTHTLHYPLILLKRITTSSGALTDIRQDITVEEYLYQGPYFDSEHRLFQGFRQIDKIDYGDGSTTGSRLTRTTYYNEQNGQQRHRAGLRQSMIVNHLYWDEAPLATQALTPGQLLNHSLSQYTRQQDPPCGLSGQRCQAYSLHKWDWQAVDGLWHGSSLVQLRSQHSTELAVAEDDAHQCSEKFSFTGAVQNFSEWRYDERNRVKSALHYQPELQLDSQVRLPQQWQYDIQTYGDFNSSHIYDRLVAHKSWHRVDDMPWQGPTTTINTYDEYSGWLTRVQQKHYSSIDQAELPATARKHHQPSHWISYNIENDTYGNIISQQRYGERPQTWTYDETGLFLLKHKDTSGKENIFSYDALGRMVALKDDHGLTQTLTYDPHNRVIEVKFDDNHWQTYQYKRATDGQAALVYSEVNTLNSHLSDKIISIPQLRAYDDQGRLLGEFEEIPEGGIRALKWQVYNNRNQISHIFTPFQAKKTSLWQMYNDGLPLQNPLARSEDYPSIVYTYDHAGRITREVSPVGSVKQTTYHSWGLSQRHRFLDSDQQSRETCDSVVRRQNQVFAIIDSLEHLHRFQRDGDGRITALLLAGEKAPRTYSYNSLGKVERIKIPGVRRELRTYDRLGRQVFWSQSEADSWEPVHIETNHYDDSSRLRKIYRDGSLLREFYYDNYTAKILNEAGKRGLAISQQAALGRLTAVYNKDPNGLRDLRTNFAYNNRGQQVLVQQQYLDPNGQIEESFVEHSRYSGDKNLLYKVDAFGSELGLHRDNAGYLSAVDLRLNWQSHAWQPIIDKMTYSPSAQLQSIIYREGIISEFHYDPWRQLLIASKTASPKQGTIHDSSYHFDGRGSITSRTDHLAHGPKHFNTSARWEYNLRNELTHFSWQNSHVNRDHPSLDFSYGPAGQMEFNTVIDPLSALEPGSDQTHIVPYSSEQDRHIFDKLGRLVTNNQIAHTRYDSSGRLLCARLSSGSVSYFGYDHQGRRYYHQKYNSGECRQIIEAQKPSLVQTFVSPSSIIDNGKRLSYALLDGRRIARIEHPSEQLSGRWFFYIWNHLGSNEWMLQPDGTPAEQMVYKPYGDEIITAELPTPDGGPHLPSNHRYTDAFLDRHLGLYQLGHRYYSPALGQFIPPDPLHQSQ